MKTILVQNTKLFDEVLTMRFYKRYFAGLALFFSCAATTPTLPTDVRDLLANLTSLGVGVGSLDSEVYAQIQGLELEGKYKGGGNCQLAVSLPIQFLIF